MHPNAEGYYCPGCGTRIIFDPGIVPPGTVPKCPQCSHGMQPDNPKGLDVFGVLVRYQRSHDACP